MAGRREILLKSTFEAKELKNVKSDQDKTTAEVVGMFTLHGVAKEVTFPIEMKYLKDKLGEHLGGSQKGDMLVITSSKFSIKRADYNIMRSAKNLDKVADTINLHLGRGRSRAEIGNRRRQNREAPGADLTD